MYNDLDKTEYEDNLTDSEIFKMIWYDPRRVFQYVTQASYDKHVPILIALMGIIGGLRYVFMREIGQEMSPLFLVPIASFLGIILTWITAYIVAGLYSWTGSWISGVATTSATIRVVAYGYIPVIVGQLLNLFIPNFVLQMTIGLIVSIWGLIITLIGLSVVHEFSILKAILNVILAILALCIISLIVILLIYWLFFS